VGRAFVVYPFDNQEEWRKDGSRDSMRWISMDSHRFTMTMTIGISINPDPGLERAKLLARSFARGGEVRPSSGCTLGILPAVVTKGIIVSLRICAKAWDH
jgi:hypothetical protein